jgi:hypothetical protein
LIQAGSTEFREAAEKRKAEQILQIDCAKEAEPEKIKPRERASL